MSSLPSHPQLHSPFRMPHIFLCHHRPALGFRSLPFPGLAGVARKSCRLNWPSPFRIGNQPFRPLPSAHCEKDTGPDSLLPRVRISDQQVVFWNRVAASDNTLLRHSWHKKSEEGWKAMAHVDLPIQKSSAFRIWSTKELHPTFHRGEWMIVVAMADDPKHILCITRFIVE